MNRTNRILAVSSLAMATVLLVAINAPAQVVLEKMNVHDIPVSGTGLVNPCNGEDLTFSGVVHVVVFVKIDPTGRFHADFHDNFHVTATGSLGNSYEGTEEDLSQFNGLVGIEQTFSTSFSEISKGSAPNFEVHALFHFTVNPNGTVTSSVNNFTTSCRG